MSHILFVFRISTIALSISATLVSTSLAKNEPAAGGFSKGQIVRQVKEINSEHVKNYEKETLAKHGVSVSKDKQNSDSFPKYVVKSTHKENSLDLNKKLEHGENLFERRNRIHNVPSPDGKGTVLGEIRKRRSIVKNNSTDSRLRSNLKNQLNQREKKNISVVLPPGADPPGSCQNRCADDIHLPCSCDITCFVYKTCCEDVSIACPSLEQHARTVISNKLIEATSHTSCISNYFMVDKCIGDEEDPLSTKTNDFIEFLDINTVVYDINTGLVFRNRAIYRCFLEDADSNNTDSLLPWVTQFDIGFDKLVDHKYHLELWTYLTPGLLTFKPPLLTVNGPTPCYPNVISSCRTSSMDPNDKCGKFLSYHIEPGKFNNPFREVYGNEFCYYCNTNRTDGMNEHRAPRIVVPPKFSLEVEITNRSTYTMTLLRQPKGVWKKASCTFTNSTSSLQINPHMESKPTCSLVECEGGGEVSGDVCMNVKRTNLYLNSPPSGFRTTVIIGLAKLIACILEQKQFGKKSDRVSIEGFSLFQAEETGDVYSSQFGNVSGDNFFSIHFDINAPARVSAWEITVVIIEAVKWFYLTNDYASPTDDKENYIAFNEHFDRDEAIEATTTQQENSEENVKAKQYLLFSLSSVSKSEPKFFVSPMHNLEEVKHVEEIRLCSNNPTTRTNAVIRTCSNFQMICAQFITTVMVYKYYI